MPHLHITATNRYSSIPLPPPGPSWYPAVMGTGILSTLLHLHRETLLGAQFAALIPFSIAWLLLIGLTLAFVIRIVRNVQAFTETIRNQNLIPMWGTVAMGILSVGSATLTILPYWFPSAHTLAFWIDATLWITATLIGIITAFGFGVVLSGRIISSPIAVWGLAVVGPMVSATVGGGLSAQITNLTLHALVVFTSTACFFVALVLGTVIFARVYHYHWRISNIPTNASISAWIPLGMVGQSSAAVQVLASSSESIVIPQYAHVLHSLANLYGYFMLSLSVPLTIWAILITLRGFKNNMAFTTGWWALTFPIGTLALGAYYIHNATDISIFHVASLIYAITLCCTVSLCIYGSLRATFTQYRNSVRQR